MLALLPILAASPLGLAAPAAQEPRDTVPLSVWTNVDWPNGLDFGNTTGISFGDYDADGWCDVFSFASGNLWRNVDGRTWILATNVNGLVPPANTRYGSAFGDYDNDGLPDIGTEPRRGGGDDCFHLLRNLGGGPNFVDVAGDPAVIDVQPCGADAETIAWGDVDGDGDLDMILPTYEQSQGSIDNQFLHNLGPTGPAGAYRFAEKGAQVGILIPPGNGRPEGAQLFDSDGDGDLDFYCNGALYRNVSGFDAPLFTALAPTEVGIRKATITDEGTIFLDYDHDGDYDLLVSYTGTQGLRLWEARGDGSYFDPGSDVIEDYRSGATFGLSAADWDNDGDIDFQAQETFRVNRWMETGERFFELASHGIPGNHIQNSTTAWGDWDRDGDMDAAIGNGANPSMLYGNDTYDRATPPAERRHVRVRVVRDSPAVPRGLETEYGASVELRVRGEDAAGPRRKQLVSSTAGYLTQGEYALTFALPADPAPTEPREDVRFDALVDLPSLPSQGFARVDKHVNPALGGIDLAQLDPSRELTVFRSGALALHGVLLDPRPALSSALVTTAGGPGRPAPGQALAAPTPSGTKSTFVGIEIDTTAATGPLLLQEILIDGTLGSGLDCGGERANLFLWDVTRPAAPELAPHGVLFREMDPRNHGAAYPVDVPLEAGRRYRLVAHVDQWRSTAISGPVVHGAFTVNGGLRYDDPDPCAGEYASLASVDPGQLYLAARIREDGARRWRDLGAGVAGSQGVPVLSATGEPREGERIRLELTGAPPSSSAWIVLGTSIRCKDVLGVTVVPEPQLVVTQLATDANGELVVHGRWPRSLERGEPLFVQAGVLDLGAPMGMTVSNALAILSED